MVTKDDFKLIGDYLEKDRITSIYKILEKTPFSSVNPVKQTQTANAMLFEGHIIVEDLK
jgi:hypothetical protein